MAQDNLEKKIKLLVIGGSAGSLRVIVGVLPHLLSPLHVAIIIVLHRKNTHEDLLTEVLAPKTILQLKEAEEKEAILPGVIYLAPADYHLLIENDHTFSLDASEKINFSRPSIDTTIESAAYAYGDGLACLLLSGANTDGVAGMKIAKSQNAVIAIQAPQSAEMPTMPYGASISMAIDHVLFPNEIAEFINNLS
ncbi:chemotaxis protein CheB [Flavipsychrobacter stenotrophus]|uniref:protein-glutamate methylesterase n=1 Tax=Flavipsychrobacter stenotrophus TaxID=2077091 RepID=A0A2S7SXK6_9BACT|nr:chemotaxis protein CheB [Flavipsychrobacter stenotrophus]PQJ11653.1 chemotaxis protein CheB [Flavipsychrobacter stenotrophus]